jgi:dTMP kinase
MVKLLDVLFEQSDADDTNKVSGVAIFRNNEDKELEVLMLKRKVQPNFNKWDFPAGHKELKETDKHAAIREVKEETGLILDQTKVMFVQKETIKTETKLDFVMFTTKVSFEKSKKIKLSKEHSQYKWFTLKELPKTNFNKKIVAKAEKKIENVKESLNVEKCKLIESKLIKYLTAFVESSHKLNEHCGHCKEGDLIVFEGIDGAGKTSQTRFLEKYLKRHGKNAVLTKWNSSSIIEAATTKAKEKRIATPLLFSLLHAADMVERYQNTICPALKKGKTVICDRYYYTSYVRDGIRGVSSKLLDEVYGCFKKPTVVFHCVVPIEVAVARLDDRDSYMGHYSSGMDMNLGSNPMESCIKYLHLCNEAYHKILPVTDKCYCKIDSNRSIKKVASNIRAEMILKEYFETLNENEI